MSAGGVLLLSYLAGIMMPLGAACAFPLYPAYLLSLTRAGDSPGRGSVICIAASVLTGVILSFFLLGLVVTVILNIPLGDVIQKAGPVLFLLLLGVALLLITGVTPRWGPIRGLPAGRELTPPAQGLVYGLFCGLIMLPCNPGPVLLLFGLGLTAADLLLNLACFLAFGAGVGTPLFLVALLPRDTIRRAGALLAARHRQVEVISGIIMAVVALYYLLGVYAPWRPG